MKKLLANDQTSLVFDTSTPVAVIGLQVKDRLFQTCIEGHRHHSQQMLVAIDGLFEQAGITVIDCDLIGFGAGPGSFTGLRIAACLAQGLAVGGQIRLVAVPTLTAIAQTAYDKGASGRLRVVQDARMSQVYHAPFVSRQGLAQCMQSVAVARPSALKLLSTDLLIGSGVSAYGTFWAEAGSKMDASIIAPSASALVSLAAVSPSLTADQALPTYVRNDVVHQKNK